MLLGGTARSAHHVTNSDGKNMVVFVFEDVSVRKQGRFTLEFRLSEACVPSLAFFLSPESDLCASHFRKPESPRLAAVTSDPFDVVSWEEYPRREATGTLQRSSDEAER